MLKWRVSVNDMNREFVISGNSSERESLEIPNLSGSAERPLPRALEGDPNRVAVFGVHCA